MEGWETNERVAPSFRKDIAAAKRELDAGKVIEAFNRMNRMDEGVEKMDKAWAKRQKEAVGFLKTVLKAR